MTEQRPLRLEDISDLRAYERERPEFQRQVFEVKRLRRVALGDIMSLVFENRLTIRYQVQEMARVEKLTTDQQILEELRVYNPLISGPGQLSATLFLELTDEASLRDWLPRLVGVERSIVFGLGLRPPAALASGDDLGEVRSMPEEAHAEQLTRAHVTSSVHYVRFEFSPAQVESFATGPVSIACDHPAYRVAVELSHETRQELLKDLRD
jgi:Protein of unknown function (DUF3501)